MGTTITISLVDEQADCLLASLDLLKEPEYRFNANSQESELRKSIHRLNKIVYPIRLNWLLWLSTASSLLHTLSVLVLDSNLANLDCDARFELDEIEAVLFY